MSITIIGNYIQLASHILTLFGFRQISKDETDAIVLVIGLIGEIVGFVTTHVGRVRAGGVNVFGIRG
jgi:hypothetical protein